MSVLKDPAVLTDDQTKTLCKVAEASSKTCSFLGMGRAGRWVCLKGTGLEDVIIAKRERGDIRAMGDNCSGPPEFTPLPE